MPVSTYEGMFVLDSAKVAANWDDAVKHVHDILAKHKGEVVASRQWDERRLAYPVQGHKKGTYFLAFFRAEGGSIVEIEADCKLSELVLRDLIVKVHPKLADLTISQAMSSTPGHEEGDGPSREEEEERPRRRRRDE